MLVLLLCLDNLLWWMRLLLRFLLRNNTKWWLMDWLRAFLIFTNALRFLIWIFYSQCILFFVFLYFLINFRGELRGNFEPSFLWTFMFNVRRKILSNDCFLKIIMWLFALISLTWRLFVSQCLRASLWRRLVIFILYLWTFSITFFLLDLLLLLTRRGLQALLTYRWSFWWLHTVFLLIMILSWRANLRIRCLWRRSMRLVLLIFLWALFMLR